MVVRENEYCEVTHGWAFQLPRIRVLPASIVIFDPWVFEVAGTDGSDLGTTTVPISLPNVVFDVPSLEKPVRKAGGMFTTRLISSADG